MEALMEDPNLQLVIAADRVGLPEAERLLLAADPALVRRFVEAVASGTSRGFLDALDWEALATNYEAARLGPSGGAGPQGPGGKG